MSQNIYMCWSGGKDSSLALYELRKEGVYNVAALLTTITEDYDRISMHGVRVALLEQQAESLGLPLLKVLIPKEATNEVYEARMRALLEAGLRQGVDTVAFGDIFLEDLKLYREKNLAQLGMKGLFPIWKRDSAELARTFIDLGFKAELACIDTQHLDPSFAGRAYDAALLPRLARLRSTPAARMASSIPSPTTDRFSSTLSPTRLAKSYAETATASATSCRIENCCSEGVPTRAKDSQTKRACQTWCGRPQIASPTIFLSTSIPARRAE